MTNKNPAHFAVSKAENWMLIYLGAFLLPTAGPGLDMPWTYMESRQSPAAPRSIAVWPDHRLTRVSYTVELLHELEFCDGRFAFGLVHHRHLDSQTQLGEPGVISWMAARKAQESHAEWVAAAPSLTLPDAGVFIHRAERFAAFYMNAVKWKKKRPERAPRVA